MRHLIYKGLFHKILRFIFYHKKNSENLSEEILYLYTFFLNRIENKSCKTMALDIKILDGLCAVSHFINKFLCGLDIARFASCLQCEHSLSIIP